MIWQHNGFILRKTIHQNNKSFVFWQEIDSKNGQIWLSARVYENDVSFYENKRFAGPFEYHGEVPDIYSVTTVDVLLQFTNLGNYIFLPIHKIPESKHKDLGYHVSTLISMESNEKVIFSFPVSDFDADKYVLLARNWKVPLKSSSVYI